MLFVNLIEGYGNSKCDELLVVEVLIKLHPTRINFRYKLF